MLRKFMLVVACASLLSACAVGQRPGGGPLGPVVDPSAPGFDPARYQVDLQQCQALAAQRDVGTGAVQGAVGGAVVGAAAGAILGAVIGGGGMAGYGAALGATNGAIAGGVGSASSVYADQQVIMHNCMAGRGYRVLD